MGARYTVSKQRGTPERHGEGHVRGRVPPAPTFGEDSETPTDAEGQRGQELSLPPRSRSPPRSSGVASSFASGASVPETRLRRVAPGLHFSGDISPRR
jgi:hypothetical protein